MCTPKKRTQNYKKVTINHLHNGGNQDIGIDSLDTVEMLMDLGDQLGAEIELEEPVETVGELVEFIEGKLGE